MKRALSIIVLVVAVVGAIFYGYQFRESRGEVVALLGILYFVALPRL